MLPSERKSSCSSKNRHDIMWMIPLEAGGHAALSHHQRLQQVVKRGRCAHARQVQLHGRLGGHRGKQLGQRKHGRPDSSGEQTRKPGGRLVAQPAAGTDTQQCWASTETQQC